jgi:aspartyl-tRNA(Asn)/glutamyl-tRNA(Gln) amidotransferase subunit C
MVPEIDVEKVARAAKVRLTAEEAKRFSREIEGILENFQKINEVDVEGLEPSFNPLRAKAELREDVRVPFKFDPFANAKFVVNRKFVGPKVLGE